MAPPTIPDADIILHNPRFVDAARTFLDVDRVAPSTVVVNVNAPMRAGAVHVDIPSFRGATRDWCPLSLLQTMGASGLFEAWRVVEVGIVTWFYTGRGGAYDYWPDGLDAPMASVRPPFDNVALVADNDRMYHRIGWIGAPDAPSPVITSTATIHHDSAGWIIRDHGTTVATYGDDDVRVSILWKARAERLSEDPPPLSRDLIAQILQSDLASRGRPGPAAPTTRSSTTSRGSSTFTTPTTSTPTPQRAPDICPATAAHRLRERVCYHSCGAGPSASLAGR